MLISSRLTQPIAATWGGRLGAVVLSLSAIDEIKRLPHQLSSREWKELAAKLHRLGTPAAISA